MLLKVTEFCAWENERWSYIFDMNKQDGATINLLMIFIRLANKVFEDIKQQEDMKPPPIPYHPIFNPHPIRVFAASRYNFEFFDTMEENGDSIALINAKYKVSLSNKCGYNHYTNLWVNEKISAARMKSAVIAIRGRKKENKLYKRFDNLFLKKKQTAKP